MRWTPTARQFYASRRHWWIRRLLKPPPADHYLRAQAALERSGLAREPHLTPREYARGVAAKRPELEAMKPLAEMHYLQRYGRRMPSPVEEEEARRLCEDICGRL